jgi:hypothetical protein
VRRIPGVFNLLVKNEHSESGKMLVQGIVKFVPHLPSELRTHTNQV